jgi:hypothetical protein
MVNDRHTGPLMSGPDLIRQVDKYQTICMVSSKPTREGGTMKRRPRASPVITIASPARDARPNQRCASDWYLCGRLRTFASKFHPEWAAAAASAR